MPLHGTAIPDPDDANLYSHMVIDENFGGFYSYAIGLSQPSARGAPRILTILFAPISGNVILTILATSIIKT
jgi:hypothetical protein